MSGPLTRLDADVACVLAPNPGPMTLTGTNTWVLGDPTSTAPVVVDPGPLDEGHLARVLDACGGRVGLVLLTHRHLDHVAGAARLADRARCDARAVDPEWRVGGLEPADGGLPDGEVVEVGRLRVEVLATPGHTSDSVCLLATGGDEVVLLTGDTVLGRGTTVITHPDGDLGAYLTSLDRLSAVVAERGVRRILPGHGPVVDDPATVLEHYREHRLERLEQVRDALAAGAVTAADVVHAVYPEVAGTPVEAAAEQSVRAQLAYLRR